MTDSSPPLHRPIPRRTFDISLFQPSEPADEPTPPSRDSLHDGDRKDSYGSLVDGVMAHSKSLLNLTSSTLLGIYDRNQGEDTNSVFPSEPATPWGVDAETPARGGSIDMDRAQMAEVRAALEQQLGPAQQSQQRQDEYWRKDVDEKDGTRTMARETASAMESQRTGRLAKRRSLGSFATRALILFVLGIGHGILLSYLHNHQQLMPIHLRGITFPIWTYALFWGTAGIALGTLLPLFDDWWAHRTNTTTSPALPATSSSPQPSNHTSSQASTPNSNSSSATDTDWPAAVRSLGAFLGLAFAVRKLPWQNALALANPALWYALDRTRSGLLLSMMVGALGTLVALAIVGWDPEMMPHTTSNAAVAADTSYRKIGVPLDGVLRRFGVIGSSGGWEQSGGWTGSFGSNGGSGADGELLGGLVSYESIGAATWLGSVLFCSCICFGNIGRKMGI